MKDKQYWEDEKPKKRTKYHREYSRIRERSPERKEKHNKYMLEMGKTPERKKALVGYAQKYQKNNQHKIKAQRKVKVALKNGSLRREICVVCGLEETIAHHPDYNKPLEVIWLCKQHHKEHHIVQRYTERITGNLSQLLEEEREKVIMEITNEWVKSEPLEFNRYLSKLLKE